MLVKTMSRMMEAMAPSSVSGTLPPQPKHGDDLSKSVYGMMREEFFVAGPFVLHGEVPPLLAAAWSLVRETLFTGTADRGQKEIVAWAVSQGNNCPFCVDAHGAAKDAVKAVDDSLEEWAKATASASALAGLAEPQVVQDHRAELLGTVAAFHYLNRMVSVYLDEKMMPVPDALDGVSRSMAKIMMGGMINKAAAMEPGRSSELVVSPDPTLAWRPDWASGSENVANALAGWSATVEHEVRQRFDEPFIDALADEIDAWNGDPTSLLQVDQQAELESTSADEGRVVLSRLARLTVAAPHSVRKEDVTAANSVSSSADALSLTAWSAQRAARRCLDWTTSGT